MRVAVVGAGISGLVAAYELAKAGVDVVLYEKEYLGGHARTVAFHGVDVDLGFMVFNRVTYPNMMELFEKLDVDMEPSDMSFSVSLDEGKGYEWGTRNGLSSLFAQKSNALNPHFWQMLRELLKFKQDVLRYLEEHENNADIDRNETLEQFVKSHGYSDLFQKAYLVPICALIWSCSSEGVMSFSAFSVLSFCRNHHLLQLFGRPQCLTVKSRSCQYVNKIKEELETRSCQIKTNCAVTSVSSTNEGCCVLGEDNSQETFDGCIIGVHAPDALRILGNQATYEELRVLGAFQYAYRYSAVLGDYELSEGMRVNCEINNDIYLHHDKSLMPRNQSAWSACNFLGTTKDGVCLTYWLNILQNLGSTSLPFLLTLNPSYIPRGNVLKWTTSHLIPSVAASKASLEISHIQGKRGIWFCGAYQGYGFHEDGLKGGIAAALGILGKDCMLLRNPKHMVPSLAETGARVVVNRFLETYMKTGCLVLLEEGGTIFYFEGTNQKSCMKSVVKVQNPLFYWKIATEADLGVADSFINGYISFVDKKDGLLNFLMILIANKELRDSSNKNRYGRGWWSPLLITAGVASASYYVRHISRKNTMIQARQNISRHYDLSNDFFSLFLDETMTYSCAIFKMENEDLKVAQLRKIHLLIEKAKIDGKHEILEIGSGWGSLAIEVVKLTGCKYTGVTLSEEQLKFAKRKAKEAGLEDRITFLLVDYRQLPSSRKYDRILSCEMIEAVGHEYMDEFFGCCESLLADNGVLVLQFTSIPDERYDGYRSSSDFIKEYIFPGGCLPSLSRVTSAMKATSRMSVEHVENIGIHFDQTLRCWRNNFMANYSKILALGFDEKFMRIWEYYFIYCEAGFKSRILGNYQMVFSRPGNVVAFNDPYEAHPSA